MQATEGVLLLSKIKENPANPRIIKDDKFKSLVKSIADFPEMLDKRPMVCVTEEDGTIIPIGGNMRLKAIKELGYKEIPESWVVMADDWSEEKRREFIIKDNISGGEWDWEELGNHWEAEQLIEWGLDIPDFGVKAEAEEDDFDTTPPEIPKTVLGDLYEIGEHRLLCGDSTQADTFEKLYNGQLADMVLTDPPYNVDYTGKTKEALKIANDKKNNEEFYQFLYDFYTAQAAYTKAGGAWYIWHADSEGANFRNALINAGIMLKQCLIWVKNSLVMGRQDYHWKHEPCLYGWKEGASHGWYSDRKQTTVLEFDRPQRSTDHPTMKPVALFGYQIGNSSKDGDIVADSFGGSGTTMLACEQMQRKAYVIEFEPKYCDVIINRMLNYKPSLKIIRNGIDVTEDWIK